MIRMADVLLLTSSYTLWVSYSHFLSKIFFYDKMDLRLTMDLKWTSAKSVQFQICRKICSTYD